MRRLDRLAVALLMALAFALVPLPASAHALLLRTDPAAGVVGPDDQPPARISLWFSEPVDVDFNAIVVIDRDGKRVDQLDAHVAEDPRRVDVTLGSLSQGAYVVRWRVTSADNHVVSGAFWFGVGFATTLPREALTDTSAPTLRPLESVARWGVLAAILALAGGALFELLVRPAVHRLPPPSRALWLLAGCVLVIGQVAWAAAQAEAVAQLPLPQALDGKILSIALLQSRFAVLWWTRLVLGIALTMSLRIRDARRLNAALGLVLIAAMSLSGHASGARELGPAAIAMDSLHLAAAAVWLGGLLQVVVLLKPILAASAEKRSDILRPLVPRVSKIALVSVAALAVTGTFSAWEQVGGFDALAVTAYGQALLLKLALVAVLVAVGAFNLLVMRPRFRQQSRDVRPAGMFRVLIGGELVLGGGVLAATALLAGLPPPGAQGLPGPIDAARQAGDLRVQLSMDPNWVGQSRFRVAHTDSRGQPPSDVHEVVLTFTMEGMNMGRTTVPMAPARPGEFEAEGFYVGMPGTSQIGVAISRSAGDQNAVFRIETSGVSEQQFRGLAPLFGFGPAATDRLPVGTDVAERGQAVYVQHCALCHGDTGTGDGPAAASLLPPPADLTLHARWHSDEQLFWFITHGVTRTPMPSFADQLTPAERWSVISHLHTLADAPTATAPREAPTTPPQVVAPTPVPASDEPIGRLVFAPDSDKDFWLLNFPTTTPVRLTHFSRLDFPSFPVWSPDGTQIAFSYYQLPRVGAIPAGTDLYLMNAEGADPRPLAMHDLQGAALLYPTWSPDGSAIYVTRQTRATGGGTDLRIERVDSRSGERQPILPNAAYPSLSRDGLRMAYVNVPNSDGSGQSLWISAGDGSGAHQILPAGVFVRFSSLHFAPDKERLLFAAVGQGTTYSPPAAGLLDLFWSTAYADGEEWDLWSIDPDGRNLQRLTSIAEDLPVATWSPDGKFIAFLGGGSARTAQTGLVVMDSAGNMLQRLTSLPGHRGADWSPVP